MVWDGGGEVWDLPHPLAPWLAFGGLPVGQSSRARAPQRAGSKAYMLVPTREKAGACPGVAWPSQLQSSTLGLALGTLAWLQGMQRLDPALSA